MINPATGIRDFAAALSVDPIPSVAIGEVVGELMEKVGPGADLVCLFVTAAHAGALEDMAAAVHTLLAPKAMIGCAASGVVGPGREISDGPGVSLWAGNVGEVEPVRLEMVDLPTGGKALSGWPIKMGWVPAGAVIFTDPYGFPTPALFDVLNNAGGFPRVVGGQAAAGGAPGTSRLVLDGKVFTDGAVGVLLKADEDPLIETVVSQGARPIGVPFVATKTEANMIHELGGEPAYRRLAQMVQSELEGIDVALAEQGMLVGKVVDEQQDTYSAGDFAIRSMIDSNAWEGTITVGERMQTGQVVQFQVPDADFASAHIRTSLTGRAPKGALLFVDEHRGRTFFGMDDHDALAAAEELDDAPIAGFMADGTFGPTRGYNTIHGLATSAALFGSADEIDTDDE